MSRLIGISIYRPHPGKEVEFVDLLRRHQPVLHQLKLVTDRAPLIARAQDGAFIEVLEWVSKEAQAVAEQSQEVIAIWEAMAHICTFSPLAALPESGKVEKPTGIRVRAGTGQPNNFEADIGASWGLCCELLLRA